MNADIDSARVCHFESDLTEEPSSVKGPRKKHRKEIDVNLADLDTRNEPNSSEDGEDDTLSRELKKKIKRSELNRDFLSIQLSEDPAKVIMIAPNLPSDVKEALIGCLREHADLFTYSVVDMLGISLDIACHHLVVDPKAKWVAQRRRSHGDGGGGGWGSNFLNGVRELRRNGGRCWRLKTIVTQRFE